MGAPAFNRSSKKRGHPVAPPAKQFFQDTASCRTVARKQPPHFDRAPSVKNELVERFDSHGEAKMEWFDYIEVFYNQRRRHWTLGQISPVEYERRSQAA